MNIARSDIVRRAVQSDSVSESAPTVSAGEVAAGAEAPLSTPAAPGVVDHAAWMAAACFAVALLAMFHDTAGSMVAIWMRSETFAHGFLILPIAAWLGWRDRAILATIPARSAPLAVILVFGAGCAWLLASLLDVLVVQQLALVAMLIAGVWAILGNVLARRLAFPLGFLFLAVPMGLSLEAPMMDLTADWTVRLLRAGGIPVYQENRFFQLPTGSWSVVAACSGVRYIIASFTLGLIYAYITYRSPWRRLAFVAASLVVPVVANVLRAWGIVLIGHYSGMKYATGVDHLIYGWVFFGVVMMLLFWIGGFWQEQSPGAKAESSAPARMPGAAAPSSSPRAAAATAALALVGAIFAPALGTIAANTPSLVSIAPLAPPAAAGWMPEEIPDGQWIPGERGADRVVSAAYGRTDGTVVLFVRQFLDQTQGEELVAHGNPWSSPKKVWRVTGRNRAPGYPAEEAILSQSGSGERLLAWSWYWIDGQATANDFVAKLLEARQQLRFLPRSGARVYITTPLEPDEAQARSRLLSFVQSQEALLAGALAEGLAPAPSP